MNHLKTAFKSLRRRLLRSFLTMLGVIIGVFSVYMMLSIAYGVTRSISDLTSSIYAQTLSLNYISRNDNDVEYPFSESDIKKLKLIDGVKYVVGENSESLIIGAGSKTTRANVIGTDFDYLIANDLELVVGQNISQEDITSRSSVAVIGQTAADALFSNNFPLHETLKVNGVPLQIIGVVKSKENNNSRIEGNGNFIIVPRTTARTHILGYNKWVQNHVQNISIIFEPEADIVWGQYQVETMMRSLRNIKASEESNFRIFSFSDIRDQAIQIQRVFTFLLGSIGGISLVVGGVGVMNIMLVSVTERTREIGLRMAVGARKSDILIQFIIEGVLLCGLAGVIGLGLGWLCCFIINLFDFIVLENSLKVGGLAFCASVFVGLAFGVMPARRAANLKPVEALRHV